MARLFFPTSSESVACKRCGSDIARDADTCPHCGADHGPAFGAAKTTALSTGLQLPFGARREVLNIQSPYPGMPEESELTGAGEQHWDMSKTVTLGAVALALVAGGIVYSQYGSSSGDDTTRSQPPAEHSAYGTIDMKTAVAMPAPAVAPAPAPAVVPAGPMAAPSVAAREVLPTESSGRASAALANAPDNLQAAREAIARGDLTTARRHFSKIPASQLRTASVQETQGDLTGLEHVRDVMLQAARDCEAAGSWLCVRQNARDVLTLDASNAEAQTLIGHAIARSGWLANKTAPATTAAHGAPHNKTQTAAAAPAAPAPAPASMHRSTVTVAAAQHAHAVAAMGVPTPILTPVPAAPAAQAVPEPTRIGTGPHAPVFNANNPDEEERAILESGWSKSPSSAQRSTPQ